MHDTNYTRALRIKIDTEITQKPMTYKMRNVKTIKNSIINVQSKK